MAGFFSKLVSGLGKTRDNIVKGLDSAFGRSVIDDDFYDELEELLIMGDVGAEVTEDILDELKDKVRKNHIGEPAGCRDLLKEIMAEELSCEEDEFDFENGPSIVMVIGVNGAGKTTTIGKLAHIYKESGKTVLIAAGDTFRAAAGNQLKEWADRAGVDMIGGKEGGDPASVVYDALSSAKSKKTDILLIDTAGRLQNKKNLMDELAKINRIIDREYPEAKRENLLVLDGTTGQNAISQALTFNDAANLTGIVLTKLDGTAKGGMAIAIKKKLNVPVKYVGVGEKIDDLQRFDAKDFVNALFEGEDALEEAPEEN